MLEAAKWALLGATVAFVIHWAIDRAAWAKASMGMVPRSRVDELEKELAQSDAALKAIAQQPVTVQAKAEAVESVSAPEPVELRSLDGPTEAQFDLLEAAGVKTVADFAALTEDQVLAFIDAQPWDSYDVGAWLAAARGSSAEPATAVTTAQLSDLPLTADQLAGLEAAGISRVEQVSALSDDELLEALGAQPWDMVDTEAIRARAKELA